MNAAQHILVLCVRIYRWTLSPAKTFLFGPLGGCRFEPSCSEYALEAVRQHGALAGSWLALKRIGRCHPWGGCGHDPVPQRQSPTPANSGFHQLVGGGFPRLDILHWLDFSRVSSGFRVFHRSGKQLPPGH